METLHLLPVIRLVRRDIQHNNENVNITMVNKASWGSQGGSESSLKESWMIYKWDIQIRYWWFHVYMFCMASAAHEKAHAWVTVEWERQQRDSENRGSEWDCVVFSNALTCVHKYRTQVLLYLSHDYILYISLTCLTLHSTGHVLVQIQHRCLFWGSAWTAQWTADALPPSQSDKQNQLTLHNKYTQTNNCLIPQRAGSRSLLIKQFVARSTVKSN